MRSSLSQNTFERPLLKKVRDAHATSLPNGFTRYGKEIVDAALFVAREERARATFFYARVGEPVEWCKRLIGERGYPVCGADIIPRDLGELGGVPSVERTAVDCRSRGELRVCVVLARFLIQILSAFNNLIGTRADPGFSVCVRLLQKHYSPRPKKDKSTDGAREKLAARSAPNEINI